MTFRRLKLHAPVEIRIEAIAEGQLRVSATDCNSGRELLTDAIVKQDGPLRGLTFKVIPEGLLVEWI